MEEYTGTELIPAKTVSDFLAMRNRVKKHAKAIRRHYAALADICDNFLQDYAILNYLHEFLLSKDAKIRKRVDGAFWKALMQTALLTNAMTEQKRKKFISKLDGKDENGYACRHNDHIPLFSREEIENVAARIAEQYAATIETTLRDVFKEFTNISYHGNIAGRAKSKLNNLRGIEKRFIARGEIQWSGILERFDIRENHNSVGFEDLLTACYICDTGVRQSYDKKFYALAMEAFKNVNNVVTTPYFTVTCYKNGNHHVKWDEAKLNVLQTINKIGAGNESSLPGPHKKKYKAEHFEE